MTKTCVSPPEVNEKQLLMYLDGEADKATIFHLERCSYCRERAEALGHFQKLLTSQVYRVTCPSSMELGEYHLQLLPSSQSLVIGQHLRQCPHCFRELAELETFLSDLTPQPSLLAPVKILIARLMRKGEEDQKSVEPPLAPAFAGLRGEDEELFIFQAENIQIIIDVQKDAEQPELKVILGLVTGLETSEYMIKASQAGQIIATSSIDEIGNFLLPHLGSGKYELTLSGPTIEILIPSFAV